jgi:hypothetical protein
VEGGLKVFDGGKFDVEGVGDGGRRNADFEEGDRNVFEPIRGLEV